MTFENKLLVQGAIYNWLTSDTFTLMTEAFWGLFITYSASFFWGALELAKEFACSLDPEACEKMLGREVQGRSVS